LIDLPEPSKTDFVFVFALLIFDIIFYANNIAFFFYYCFIDGKEGLYKIAL
jgi:hypothetical protein